MTEIRKNQVRTGQRVELRFISGHRPTGVVVEVDRNGTDTCPPSITIREDGAEVNPERKYLYSHLESVHLLGAGRW